MIQSQKSQPDVCPQALGSTVWTKATKSLLYQQIQSKTQTLLLSRQIIPSDCEPLALAIVSNSGRSCAKAGHSSHPISASFFTQTHLAVLAFTGTSTAHVSDKGAPFSAVPFLKHLLSHLWFFLVPGFYLRQEHRGYLINWCWQYPTHGRGQEDKTL